MEANWQRRLEKEVSIVSVASEGEEENSSTLLIAANPRYFKEIDRIIAELDKPPAQVLVQVLLAEVALDDDLDYGFDWDYTTTWNDSTTWSGS